MVMNISQRIINIDEINVREDSEVLKYRSRGNGGGDRV
jgi:hypothetical protein